MHQVAGWAGEVAAVAPHGLLADGAAGLVGHRWAFGCHGGPRGVEPLIRRVCPACLIIPAALFCCPPRRAFIARWLARFTGPYVRCRMPTVSLRRLPELAVSWCPRGRSTEGVRWQHLGRSRATSTAAPRSPAAARAVAVSAGSYEGPQIRGAARPGGSTRPGSNKPRPRGFGAGRFGRHFSRRLSHYSIAETSASHDTPDLTQVVDGATSWLCEPGDLLLGQPAPQGLVVDFDLSCRLA